MHAIQKEQNWYWESEWYINNIMHTIHYGIVSCV